MSLEAMLKVAGYPTGPVDGVFDDISTQALMSYWLEAGYPFPNRGWLEFQFTPEAYLKLHETATGIQNGTITQIRPNWQVTQGELQFALHRIGCYGDRQLHTLADDERIPAFETALRCYKLAEGIAPPKPTMDGIHPKKLVMDSFDRPGFGATAFLQASNLSPEDDKAMAPACKRMDRATPDSIYGFRAEMADPHSPGLTVTEVFETGRARGALYEGDLLIGMNDMAFVEFGVPKNVWKGYDHERGIYLYGFRDGNAFEAVLPPCWKKETMNPFTGVDYFDFLYSESGREQDVSTASLVAGFVRGKNLGSQGHRHPSYTKRNPYQLGRNYCWVKATRKLSAVRTSGKVSSTGRLYDQTKLGYNFTVDSALHDNVSENFNLTHNDRSFVLRQVELAVTRMLSRVGCASPEWKGLEMKVYELAGEDWYRWVSRSIDWEDVRLDPPG